MIHICVSNLQSAGDLSARRSGALCGPNLWGQAASGRHKGKDRKGCFLTILLRLHGCFGQFLPAGVERWRVKGQYLCRSFRIEVRPNGAKSVALFSVKKG